MTGTSTPVPVVCAAVDGFAEAWLTVPCRPDQVCVVREFVRRQLADDPRAETAVLLASELATNSVQHSSSRLGRVMTVIVVAARDGIVLVGVADAGGATVPVLRDEDGGCAEGGRGLRLVSHLCPKWGFRIQPDGGLVTWFALGQGRREQADGRGGVGASRGVTLRDGGRCRGVLGAPPRARPERYRERVATATDSRASRFAVFDAALARQHPAGPHQYLAILAVRSDRQGRGANTELRARHKILDREPGTAAYPEASSRRAGHCTSPAGTWITGFLSSRPTGLPQPRIRAGRGGGDKASVVAERPGATTA
jgi:anti-sigma regulatory factor (Ser/Thr protein kinase)